MRKAALCFTCVVMFLLSSCGQRYVVEADKGVFSDKTPADITAINSLGQLYEGSTNAVKDSSDAIQGNSSTRQGSSSAALDSSDVTQGNSNAQQGSPSAALDSSDVTQGNSSTQQGSFSETQGNSNAQQEALIDKILSPQPSLGEEEKDMAHQGIKLNRVELTEGFYYEELSENTKSRIAGKSYPTDCNVPYSKLRYVKVLHYDFNGNEHEGELICAQEVAHELTNIFYELYLAKYPIEKMVLVDEYDADDIASMKDNNTSCFNYRVIEGSKKLSMHSYGMAIDINPLINPYVKGDYVSPKEAKDYVDRSQIKLGMIDKDDLCYKLFTKYGWKWGGSWNTIKDYQHFEKEVTK